MSTNRFKSNVLNRFLNTTNTNTNNTESSNDREQTGGFARDNFSVFRRQGNNTTNNALSSISSITTAALSLIKTNKTQVSHTKKQIFFYNNSQSFVYFIYSVQFFWLKLFFLQKCLTSNLRMIKNIRLNPRR